MRTGHAARLPEPPPSISNDLHLMREAACCSIFGQYFLSRPAMLSRHGSSKCSFDAAHTWAASRKESRIARTVALKLKSRESSEKTDSLSHGSSASASRPSVIRPRRERLQQRTCWQALYQSCPPPSSAHEKRARGRS